MSREDYEQKMQEFAQKVAFAKEIAKDDWWDRHELRHAINGYIDGNLIRMGDLVYDELSSPPTES